MSATVYYSEKRPQRLQSSSGTFRSNRETPGGAAQDANQLTRQKAYSFDDMEKEPNRAQPPTPEGRPLPLIVQGRLAPNRVSGRAPGQLTMYFPQCRTESTPVKTPALGSAPVMRNMCTSI